MKALMASSCSVLLHFDVHYCAYLIAESRAISRYIDAKSGGKLSHRDNLAEWALVETWTSVETSNFDKHASGKTHSYEC